MNQDRRSILSPPSRLTVRLAKLLFGGAMPGGSAPHSSRQWDTLASDSTATPGFMRSLPLVRTDYAHIVGYARLALTYWVSVIA